jgi:two pore calcium channel protein
MTAYRNLFARVTTTAVIRLLLLSILCLGGIADNLIVIYTYDVTYFSQFARPFVFFLFMRSVRETIVKMIHVVWDSKGVIGLLIMLLLFYSGIGMVLYKDSDEGKLYFSSFGEAFWNMLILLTSTNFPDVMLPVYQQNRWMCWFFVSFLLLGMFFLMNAVIDVFYHSYRKQVKNRASRF